MSPTATGIGFGRVCLLGDHCDWAQRQVLASSIDRAIVTRAKPSNAGRVGIRISNTFHQTRDEASFELERAPDIPLADSSLKYVNAVIAAIMEDGLRLGGADLDIESDVPMKKGLSSSAALCVSASRALSALFSLNLSSDDVVRISYRAENGLLGIGCGMMDQTAAAHEEPLFMDFQGGFRYREIDLKRALPLVIADTGGERDTKLILNSLNHHYFRERDPLIVRTLGTDIPRLVKKARAEMEGSCRLERIGRLMNENQSCYDRGLRPFCPQELDTPLLYDALDIALEAGALGAKWTGAGGEGSIIALARDEESCGRIADALRDRFSSMVVSVG